MMDTIETIISSLQIDYDSNLRIADSFVLFDVRLIFIVIDFNEIDLSFSISILKLM